MQYMPSDVAGLVRDTEFDPAVYDDRALFDLEMERLFDRAWLLVGHDSLVKEPGSYFTTRAGSHPILVWRGMDGVIRAFLNRCTHRGVRLCQAERGKAPHLSCPYHAWMFGADGRLNGYPSPEEYGESFDPARWGLQRLGELDLYRGFIFVRVRPGGPDLKAFLGEVGATIDNLVDRAPEGEVEAYPIPVRHRYHGNWKFGFENLNDTHHARVAHASSIRAATRVMEEMGPEASNGGLGVMRANGQPIRDYQQLDIVTTQHGHSYMHGFIDKQRHRPFPDDYVERLTAARGMEEAERILSISRHLTLIYPSATLHARFPIIRLIQPIRADLTESVGYIFRLKGAPERMFQETLDYFMVSISPFSPILTDDLYLYETAQWLSRSREAGPVVVSRLYDQERRQGEKAVHIGTSEAFIRNQYAAWLRYMREGE